MVCRDIADHTEDGLHKKVDFKPDFNEKISGICFWNNEGESEDAREGSDSVGWLCELIWCIKECRIAKTRTVRFNA